MKFEIGKHQLVISKNYLSNKESTGGRAGSINAEAVFLDLKDLTANNEFEKKRYNKKVLFTIFEKKNRLPLKKNFEKQRKILSSKGNQVDIGDLKLMHFASPNDLNLDEMYAVMKGNDVERYVICYKYTMTPYPTCQSSVDYEADLVVEYIFDRQRLAEWLHVEQRVNQLVKSFEK